MNELETLIYSVNNKVASISLNSTKTMNAFSQLMRLELKQAIDEAESDSNIRAVILRAEGKGFTSGTDLTEGLAGFNTIEEQILQEYKPIISSIGNSTKPYLASIHGACAGVGAGIALSCDLAIMSENAFLYVPFAGLSLVPDGGMSHYLVEAMGYKRAYQTFLEGGRIKASDCLHYGMVNKVVAADELRSQTDLWAETIAKGAPLAQKFGKQIMRQVHLSSFEETLELEAKLQNTCISSKDSENAISAFFEKREVEFIGE